MIFNRGDRKAFKAGADLSTKQYFAVKLSAGQVVLAAAATDEVIGILQNAPKQGDVADVLLVNAQGTTKAIANAAITAGARVGAAATGKLATLTQAAAGAQPTQRSVGIALKAAGADGDTFELMLLPQLY